MNRTCELAMRIGKCVWDQTFALGMDRLAAMEAMIAGGLDGGAAVRSAITGEWYHNGLPRVVVPHKLASSFMCTTMGATDVPDLVAPWSVFVIDIPTGMVPGPDGSDLVALLAYDLREEGGRSVGGYALPEHPEHRAVCLRTTDSASELTATVRGEKPVQQLLARFLAGVIAELSQYRPSGAASPSAITDRTIKRDPRGNPTTRTMVLSRPVRVDCRPRVAAYLSGDRKSAPTVQSLVAGHWKQTPHGPKNEDGSWGADRRWAHIEPYWRGNEDAPLALRPHILC